jgi:adenylate kinase
MLLRKDPKVYEQSAGGALASSDDVMKLLDEAISEVPGGQPIVLDGVARKPEEIKWLDAKLNSMGRPMTRVIRLVVPEDVLMKRLFSRSEIEGRVDDDEAGILKRIDVYNNITSKNQDWWSTKLPIIEVDGIGTPDEVEARIWGAVQDAA